MKYIDINRAYTEKVSKYIAMGMTINTATMAGSQGETAHVDLTDGKKIYRILLETFHDFDDQYFEGIRLAVGISTDQVAPNGEYKLSTIWNNGLEIIEEEKFYKVADRGESFYGTRDEADDAMTKRYYRRKARNPYPSYGTVKKDITSEKTLPIAIEKIKKDIGIKRVNRRDVKIEKIVHSSDSDCERYRITYHGKCIPLG